MTRKEIERAKASLPKLGTRYSAEQKRLSEEISCREMINSILCYHGEKEIERNRYMTKHILNLGIRRVREIIDEQISDFKKAKVIFNVVPGYNSIIWEDESEEKER